MRKVSKIWLAVLAAAFCVSVAPVLIEGDAHAIPAFARKHKVSCTMCHVAVPKLKPFGEEYAGNGFAFPEGAEPESATIETGDDRLLLLREFPIGVRIDAYIRADESGVVEGDFQTPYGLKLLSGGRVSRNVSYYFYFYIDERGEVAGLEDAYLHFNDIAGTDLDIMAGQFQVSDPLFKRELRLTFEDYLIYKVRPGFSLANLTYDRGLMLTYSLPLDLDVVGQVLNGNGIPEAENRVFDVDTQKAVSLRLSRAFGPLRLGVFGYYNEELNEERTRNDVYYAGADGTFGSEKLELNVQYLRREDSNAFFLVPDSTDTETDGGFVEVTYLPKGQESAWLFTALYNQIESVGTAYDVQRVTASASHLPARNLRFIIEYTYDIEVERSEGVVGVMAAF